MRRFHCLFLALLIYVSVRFRASQNQKRRNSAQYGHRNFMDSDPVLILVGIAVPSFRLLYYTDRTARLQIWSLKYLATSGIGIILTPTRALLSTAMVDKALIRPGQIRLLSVDNPLVVQKAPASVLVTGNDVMHSFFVPALAVQTYAFIGRTNEAWIDVPVGAQTLGVIRLAQTTRVNRNQAVSKAEYAAWLGDVARQVTNYGLYHCCEMTMLKLASAINRGKV
ncbi:MAG: hypothetical protein CM15mP46_3690 [Alphaproteobacteria bacterium]|nr:MAG: hypothetical protein CM15mP46_3690 [Alphaproteobacteria bacterium]